MGIYGRAGCRSRSGAFSGKGFRFLLFVLCHAVIAGQLAAQSGSLDPAFEKIPLNRWLSERDHSHFRWSVRVWPTVLSYQQRLRTRVSIRIDGGDLLARRGQGELLMLVQYSDRIGGVYQNHGSIDLQNLDNQVKSIDMIWDLDAFVVPGEYRISFAICHTATGEHSTTQRTLRVEPLRADPLADAWRGIPAVEFLEVKEPPESWYLPSLFGCLNLSLETHRPVHIDILLNSTPSELAQESQAITNNRNLGKLIPLLKVLTQIKVRNGTTDAALLDLMLQRVSFEQRDIHELDWERLKAALLDANPNLIDAQSLANRRQMAQFFVGEVSRRIIAASASKGSVEPLRVLIVLSGPMAFPKPADLHPIEAKANTNLRVYYIHFGPLILQFGGIERTAHGDPRRPPRERSPSGPVTPPDQMDYLESLIKPLKPRVFEVRTPYDFRNALGTILGEISGM